MNYFSFDNGFPQIFNKIYKLFFVIYYQLIVPLQP